MQRAPLRAILRQVSTAMLAITFRPGVAGGSTTFTVRPTRSRSATKKAPLASCVSPKRVRRATPVYSGDFFHSGANLMVGSITERLA